MSYDGRAFVSTIINNVIYFDYSPIGQVYRLNFNYQSIGYRDYLKFISDCEKKYIVVLEETYTNNNKCMICFECNPYVKIKVEDSNSSLKYDSICPTCNINCCKNCFECIISSNVPGNSFYKCLVCRNTYTIIEEVD